MTEYLDLIVGMLAACAVLFIVGGYAAMQQRRRFDARLATYLAGSASVSSPSITLSAMPVRSRPPRKLVGINQLELLQAGMTITAGRFLFVQLTLATVGLAVAWFFGRSSGIWLLAVMAAGFVAGVAIPRMFVQFKRNRRLLKFEAQFANAVDALANAAEVGLGISQGMAAVSRDMPAPLGPAFGRALRTMGMGISLTEALDQLADRVPTHDVDLFVAALSIQYRTGGALSPVLRKIADTIRERINLRSEIRALTAQARYSSYLIAVLPVFLAAAMRFISPAYFEMLLQPGLMRLILAGSVVGVIVGLFFMLRIADVEV